MPRPPARPGQAEHSRVCPLDGSIVQPMPALPRWQASSLSLSLVWAAKPSDPDARRAAPATDALCLAGHNRSESTL